MEKEGKLQVQVQSEVSADALAGAQPDPAVHHSPGDQSLVAWLHHPPVLLLFLAAVTFILYAGTLTFQFVMDETFQVANNLLIRNWHNLPHVFTTDLLAGFTRSQYYRPLFTCWSMLIYSIFGLQVWGWHLQTILVHIGATVSVFYLSRKLGLQYWTAALAAMIFALHPAHVESATCVLGYDSMMTVFFALSFWAFLKSREPHPPNHRVWRLASFAFLVCALLTKETAITFLAVVAAYCWLFPPPAISSPWSKLRNSFLEALPYAVVVTAYLFLRKIAIHRVTVSAGDAHFSQVVFTLPDVLCSYIRMLLFPVRLGALYYNPYVETPGLANFWLPLLMVAAAGAGLWYWSRRSADHLIAFASLWMILTLSPALYLPGFFGNGDFVHDRYLYLPSIGFAILLAKGIRLLPAIQRLPRATVQIAASSVLALAYLAGAYNTQLYWGSNLLISYRAHTLYPQYEYATVAYATELSQRGRYDQAIALLKPVIASHPQSDAVGLFTPTLALGDAYLRGGDLKDGRTTLAQVATLSPNSGAPAQNMATVARAYAGLADFDHALPLCSQALQKEPDLYSVVETCGNVSLLAGRYTDAERILSHSVTLAPDRAAPRHLLGRVYFETGRLPEALSLLGKAVEIDSSVYEYHLWYAKALVKSGDNTHARSEFLAALALNNNGPEAKAGLAALPGTQ